MAVVRIKAEPRWLRRAAAQVTDARLARELLRAADRRSHMAEITAREARALAEALPGDQVASDAARTVTAAETREMAELSVRRARWDKIRRGLSD